VAFWRVKKLDYWTDTSRLAEAKHTYTDKADAGFFDVYLSGDLVLDIGYKGGGQNCIPILPKATGVDLDFPGYDGITLPFDDGTVDAVYSSHCLEHIPDYTNAFLDWMRVLKIGGYMVIVVPHMHLYEQKLYLPSDRNRFHKRFYTPSRLLREIEETLHPSCFQVCHLRENRNQDFDYWSNKDVHPAAPYEIEVVLRKTK
jgi:SAM-dependent methyltransferase